MTKVHRLPLLEDGLKDKLGRIHTSLRVSVTDRCNIRCRYCMPDGDVKFLPPERWLSFEAMERFIRVVAGMGVRKVRLTGGEPLMRPGLHELVSRISAIQGIDELALTTNGMLLEKQIDDLVRSGLKRVNISLDTLNETTFHRISRREGIHLVLKGIQSAIENRLDVRLNALVIKNLNDQDVIPLVEFARKHRLSIRFIEFMPLDADRNWSVASMVTGEELRKKIASAISPLIPVSRSDPSQPATDYIFEDGLGEVGFIDSVTAPFCASCNRIRMTAEGKLRNCLFGRDEWDVAPLLSEDGTEEQIRDMIRDCVAHKFPAHGISSKDFQQPDRAMYQIGG